MTLTVFSPLSAEEENAEAAKARTTLPGTAEEEIGNAVNCQLQLSLVLKEQSRW